MTEKDWLREVSLNPTEALPVFRDWLLEQGDEAGAAFCRFLLKRQECLSPYGNQVGPGRQDTPQVGQVFYWWFQSKEWFFSRGRGIGDELPIELSRHRLTVHTKWALSSRDFSDPVEAWEGAFSAWRNAYSAEALEEFR